MGSDHCTYSSHHRAQGKNNFTAIPQGINGIEERVAIVYECGVVGGNMDMMRFVEITSTSAAKLHNIYPMKGCIAEGSVADIVIWNPSSVHTISQKTQNQTADFNIFEGMKVTGGAEFVILRGKIVVAEYQVNVSPGDGQFVETLSWPA